MEASSWQGAQLQEVLVDGRKKALGGSEPRSLRLGFFHEGRVKWLIFEYKEEAPLLMTFVDRRPPLQQKIRRPLELFLRSAFLGRRLTSVAIHKTWTEPQLTLEFGEGYWLKFLVVPKFRNVWAIANDKQISEFKPQMVPANWGASDSVRSPSYVGDESPNSVDVVQESRLKDVLVDQRAKLKKLELAMGKVVAELDSKINHPARSIGEWIKTHQTLEIPRDQEAKWRPHINKQKSLAENIESLFRTAKSQESKRLGTEKRLRQIEQEVARLKKDIECGKLDSSSSSDLQANGDLFKSASARGRKTLVAEDLTFYIGRNAKENLAILRKAQPFDYWLHVKDQPGAHGILRRNRTRVVSDEELKRAATALIENALKRRAIELRGEVYDVLVVECRFVRPIKGDRLGRVHYANDRVLRVRL